MLDVIAPVRKLSTSINYDYVAVRGKQLGIFLSGSCELAILKAAVSSCARINRDISPWAQHWAYENP